MQKTVKELKLKLGVNFKTAIQYWESLKGKSFKEFTDNEITLLEEDWELLNAINKNHIEGMDLKEIALSLVVNRPSLSSSVENMNNKELSNFINSLCTQWKQECFTEHEKKDNVRLLKIQLKDIEPKGDLLVFNGDRTYDPLKVDTPPKNGIPVLKTSENGIYRMLKEKGLSSISVFMYESHRTQDEKEKYEAFKRKVLTEGFVLSKGNGKKMYHYYPAFQSASSNRQATIQFVQVNGKTHEERINEIVDLWVEISGTKSAEGLMMALTHNAKN